MVSPRRTTAVARTSDRAFIPGIHRASCAAQPACEISSQQKCSVREPQYEPAVLLGSRLSALPAIGCGGSLEAVQLARARVTLSLRASMKSGSRSASARSKPWQRFIFLGRARSRITPVLSQQARIAGIALVGALRFSVSASLQFFFEANQATGKTGPRSRDRPVANALAQSEIDQRFFPAAPLRPSKSPALIWPRSSCRGLSLSACWKLSNASCRAASGPPARCRGASIIRYRRA